VVAPLIHQHPRRWSRWPSGRPLNTRRSGPRPRWQPTPDAG